MHCSGISLVWLILLLHVLEGIVGGTESQFLGYEQNIGSDVLTDNEAANQTLLTDVRWSFPSDGHVIAFHVRIHGDAHDNLIIQIWRPEGGQTFSLVGASLDVNATLTGTQRVEPDGVITIRRGDVLGISFLGINPVPYQNGDDICKDSWLMYNDGPVDSGDKSGKFFSPGNGCRRYLVTAEYQIKQTDLRMDILGFDVLSRSIYDNTTNAVVIPNSNEGFPFPGELFGWKAFLEEPNQPVVFQVWRPKNSTLYHKIHETPPFSLPIIGAIHTRLRPQERINIDRGDVIAIGHSLRNPVHYEVIKSCQMETLVKQPIDGEQAEFGPVVGEGACRHYSFQAEYHKADVTAPPFVGPVSHSVTLTSNPPVNVSSEPTTMTSTTLLTSTKTATTTSALNIKPMQTSSSLPPSPPTSTITTDTIAMETSSSSQLSPTPLMSSVAPSTFFGWDVDVATRNDGVHYGTIIPDVGKVFPFDGKIIGWEFNVTNIKHKVGLQVWRPMPKHAEIFPHGRDFAFVGETKPVWPWHVGLNSFTVDQVGAAPIHVRAGDVIGLRLDQPNPVPFADSSECDTRFYMDHHGRFDPCDQLIFQATSVCRVYPIRALVIWEEEQEIKPKECIDISESLIPGGGAKPTHIDGCLVLNIKSPGATYLLDSPGYPNITKHYDLCWVIQIDPSLQTELYIQVKLNDLDLHVPKRCDSSASDFLEIRDGKSSKSDILRRYCVGWASGNDVTRTDVSTACQNYMYIHMRTSRSSFNFRGFKLHYQAISKDLLHKTCLRPLPLAAPNADRSRNAAIITVLVVMAVIAVVFAAAYIRKHGFKSPGWLSFVLFKHQRFDNPIGHGLHSTDSPSHTINQPEQSGGGTNHSEYHLQREGFDAAYVQFSPGGYPNNGQPVLRLGNIDTKTANAPSIMEGVSELPEVMNGVITGQGSSADIKPDHGGSDHDLFPPPNDSFRNNNITILPSQHVIVDHEPHHSVT